MGKMTVPFGDAVWMGLPLVFFPGFLYNRADIRGGPAGRHCPTEKGLDNTMKLGIGVQTPDSISPYLPTNAAKA